MCCDFQGRDKLSYKTGLCGDGEGSSVKVDGRGWGRGVAEGNSGVSYM